jgi:hypothetical protein
MKRVTLISFLLPALAACQTQPPSAMLLRFSEQDAGGQPYETRMLLDRAFLRIDEGQGADGFLLLDRATRTLYSVSHGDRTVLVIRPLPVASAAPAEFENRVVREEAGLPAVAGKTVSHYRLFTNDRLCAEVFSADGLLPDAVAALREYHQVLAGEQAQAESRRPAEQQSVCDLADFVFTPARYLDHGFPVRFVTHSGHLRQLIDYTVQYPSGADWRILPPDYRRYSIADMAPRR